MAKEHLLLLLSTHTVAPTPDDTLFWPLRKTGRACGADMHAENIHTTDKRTSLKFTVQTQEVISR